MKYYRHGTKRMALPNDRKPSAKWAEITKAQYDAIPKIAFEIAKTKKALADTDYKALKFLDGALTEEEYAPIKAERQALRDKINELEAKL